MMKRVRPFLWMLMVAALQLKAQVAGPSPLASEESASAVVPGAAIIAESQADTALQLGFSATAAGAYREILRDAVLAPEAKSRIILALATALLESGEIGDATRVLQAYSGPKNSAYQLRMALVALAERRPGQAKAALGAGRVEDLPAADVGWWYFVQAQIADAEGDADRRKGAYAQANAAALSELQRTRFAVAQDQALLRRGPLDEARLANLKKTVEDNQGRGIGYELARTYAAALASAGRGGEAQTFLQRQLAAMPATERNWADQLRLALGMVAGEKTTTGRNALRELLRNGQRAETQRLALHLLAKGAITESDRTQLRRDLAELIGAASPHPVIEDLLLASARLALTDRQYAAAEIDARKLLDQYPGTALKAEALKVRLAVAWDQERYRAAADLATQLRAELPPGRERSELGVLLAEAFFRAPDYKSAADAYDAALREAPLSAPAGDLIFQRVLSDIRANQIEAAAKLLDEAAANPAFDPLRRWQAEWNLVKAMQVREQMAAASARVDRLLAGGAEGVPDDLRVRLMWLRAKLSLDAGDHEGALKQTDDVLGLLQKSTNLPADLQANVVATTQLLKARALLSLGREQEGFATLEKLRRDHKGTAAAQNSFLIQASFLSDQREDLAGAQRVLQSFVDAAPDYPNSPYVPLALYQIALILERQGLDRHLREAYEKLEKLVQDYSTDEMVFYARLKQGDLLRKLTDFAAARQVYEALVNNESRHPDVLLAQLALADCLFALGANSAVNAENAAAIYERLRDLPSAPVDLRVEAGFKWAAALIKRAQSSQGQIASDQMTKAQTVFWSVVDTFLLDPAVAKGLGAKGRYWISKSLLELAQLHEAAGRSDEAQRAYQLILDYRLSGVAQAEAKLARFRPVEEPKS